MESIFSIVDILNYNNMRIKSIRLWFRIPASYLL